MKVPIIIEYADSVASSCSFWRSRGVLSELSKKGEINIISGTWWEDNWTVIRNADIAFFQRPMNKDCFSHIALCKDLGLKIWIDYDDSPIIHPSHEVYNIWCETFDEREFLKINMLADVISASTDYLKRYYLGYCNNVIVIPNAINDYWLKFKKKSSDKNILWRGGKHHLSDIWEYKDEIIEVMRKHPDWTLTCLGSEVKFLSDKLPNYKYGGDYDIHQYFGYILTTQPSIFIVPLSNNELNLGKSNISWQEATLCGATSLTPSHWKLNGKSGVYKDKKTFKSEFEKLIVDEDYRTNLYEKALTEVKSKYLLSNVNKQRLQLIKNLMK